MEASVYGYALVGKPAVFVVHIKDDVGNIHERTIPLKLKSKYQAEIAAIKYACQAISRKDVHLTIKTSVSQIPQVFTKTGGNWLKRKTPNQLIDDVRELADQFSSFNCVVDDASELMLKIKEIARQASI